MAKTGWQGFVTDYGIPWKRAGGNNIEVECPWCNDGSYKLGLSLRNSKYGCWKQKKAHGGVNPVRLLQKFLGLSEEKAKNLADSYFDYIYSDNKPSKIGLEAEPVTFPYAVKEFMGEPYEIEFFQYLANRGFDPGYVIKRFDLRYALSGPFTNRIILPVRENNTLYTWVGRTIDPSQDLRYKAAGDKITKNKLPDYLHDIDNLKGGDTLVITEGFFDSMAISQALIPGVHATCIFGKFLTAPQIYKIMQLSKRYKRVVTGFDSTALDSSWSAFRQLSWYSQAPIVMIAPPNKDWADSTKEEIKGVLLNV